MEDGAARKQGGTGGYLFFLLSFIERRRGLWPLGGAAALWAF